MNLSHLMLLATVMTTAFVLANPASNSRIMELEDKMMNGTGLSAEDSLELGQLTGAGSALLVKRDSCSDCQKDYQCALLSCDDFCKGCQNCKCGVCGGWFWHTCHCYSNEGDCD
ncbi:hypothetical protein BG006_007032 [Podila minutissima]|uniref:Uncharacterized protein n=1 Tax=Podila minutissima TaxID=64525 RepID=A0A9P5SM53_9FUNG|nr:hypothetical protein BG006_007032 [Podila minutissima]